MANSFFNTAKVLNEGIMLLENEMVLGKLISNDYSIEFAAKNSTVNIRRPTNYTVQRNNLDITSTAQDIEQATIPVTLTKTATIPVQITALQRTLDFDRVSEDIIKPAMVLLKDEIEQAIAAEYYRFYNFSGTPGTAPATFLSLANPGAMMDNFAIPQSGRIAIHAPEAAAVLADGLKGTFVQGIAKKAIEKADFGEYANFQNYKSQHAPTHIAGVATGTPLVNGSTQNTTYALAKQTMSQTLNTDGWTNSTTGILRKGDVFTIAGVMSVNPVSKQSTGKLQHFTVLADANSGATTGPAALTISPPIITTGAYQTVIAAPADNAAITVVSGTAGASNKQSLLLHPSAMTLVTRAIDIPQGQGVDTSTKSGNRVTVSCTNFVNGNTLTQTMRFDMLYEAIVIDPRMGLRLTN